MKKRYYIIAITAVILLLFISLWCYFQYQKKTSFQVGIHQKTDILFKIDTYEIAKNVVTYFKGYDSIKSKSIIKSIEVPANIFIYTLKNKKKTTFFGSVKITDYPLFEKLTEKDFSKNSIDSNIKMLTSKDQKLIIVYNKNTAAFSYSQTKEKVIDVLTDIINKKDILSIEKSSFKNIINKKGQIVFYDGINEGYLNLAHNKIQGIALLHSKKIIIPKKTECPVFEKENIVSFWLQADIKSIIPHKTYNIDKYKIDLDSILSSFQNEIQLEITEPVIQKDSIITYDFDDNFEKIEIVKVNETLIPGLSLWVQSNTNQLYNYLYKQQIITNNKEVNKKVFPLYQLHVFKGEKNILFSTKKHSKISEKKISDNFLYLKINFDKMRKQKEFSPFYKYIINFKTLEMKAHQFENKTQLDLDLELENTHGENPIISIWNLINLEK